MAIHPIDLSTVYSQMDKVAKYSASQNQNTELAGMVNMNKAVQDDMKKAQSVQETAKNSEADSAKIKDENSSDSEGSSPKKKNNESQEEEKPRMVEIQDPGLGNIIDITT